MRLPYTSMASGFRTSAVTRGTSTNESSTAPLIDASTIPSPADTSAHSPSTSLHSSTDARWLEISPIETPVMGRNGTIASPSSAPTDAPSRYTEEPPRATSPPVSLPSPSIRSAATSASTQLPP